MKKIAIAIMTKAPIPGVSKTRLSPPLTLSQAAFLSFCFLSDIVNKINKINRNVDLFIFYTPKRGELYLSLFRKVAKLEREKGITLGDKIFYIFNFLFHRGYKKVVIIPSDCPDIPLSYIIKSFKILTNNSRKIILGPSKDGAFYLIGANRSALYSFESIKDINWSESFSTKNIIKKFKKKGIFISLAPLWYDIDTIRDFRYLVERLDKNRNPYTYYFVKNFLNPSES